MTKIEKETVVAALSEYAFHHQKIADKAEKQKDYKTQSEHHAKANMAMAMLTYWMDVVNMPNGSVTI